MSHLLRYGASAATRRAPLAISGDAPDGPLGLTVAYDYQISGGRPPYTVTVISGSLPPGLTLETPVTTGRDTGIVRLSGTLTE